MFIAIDIGNTRTSCGIYDHESLRTIIHFPALTPGSNIPESVQTQFADFPDIHHACIASVVPRATYPTSDALKLIYPNAEMRVLSHDDIPINSSYRNPDEVGTDRLLGSLAAYSKYGKGSKRAVIVVDLGTATVFDCIDKEGIYLGGAIALGIESGAKQLSQLASLLPQVPLEFPKRVLGKTTEDCMQSGILFGALSMIEGMVKRLSDEAFQSEQPIVVTTGGLAALVKDRFMLTTYHEPHLVLEGIRIANQEKNK